MGRSVNSFTHWVGDTSMEGDRVTLPEKELWVAVLSRAALDACKGPPRLNMDLRSNVTHQNHYDYNRDQARHFFLKGGSHFKHICEMAGRDPEYVQTKIRKVILRNSGWNADVPITSHYRRRGRPKKKHLTGNSYYAAMGKKRGRPRIYNHV